jgi:hypothetical protein
MTEKPTFSVVPTDPGDSADPPQPPRPLGTRGRELWNKVQGEFNIADAAGLELLFQACAAADRAEELAATISKHGPMIAGRLNPCIRAELANRNFIVNTLARLGVTLEPLKPIGRPPTQHGWSG